MEIDITAIGFVISTIGLFLIGVFKSISIFGKTANKLWKKVIIDKSKVKPLLNEFIFTNKNVCRATLLKLSNGGGLPHTGAVLYSTIIADASINNDSYELNWQRVIVEDEYLQLLKKVAIYGLVDVDDTSKLEEGSVKDASLSKNIKSFTLYHVQSKDKYNWYYLAISKCNNDFINTFKYRDNIRILKKEIQKLIK